MTRLRGACAALVCARALAQPPPPYAIWAHCHWVWLSGGATQQQVTQYLADYAARNITVGAVDIDSSWSTGYQNFVVGEAAYEPAHRETAAAHSARPIAPSRAPPCPSHFAILQTRSSGPTFPAS